MIITLTTDFGLRDPFVAVMKGVILGRSPGVAIVDVTHDIPQYSPAEAGFWLRHAYRYFPPYSVHVAVVDPGVGTARSIVAVELESHLFLAPDNGLLGPVVAGEPAAQVRRVDVESARQRFALPDPSATFHGRDVFAPLAAELVIGRAAFEDLGPTTTLSSSDLPNVAISKSEIRGSIVTIDHFGNLITNIEAAHLLGTDAPVLQAHGQNFPLVHTYGDVPAGQCVAIVNSWGLIEIASAQGNAARVLGFHRGEVVTIRTASYVR